MGLKDKKSKSKSSANAAEAKAKKDDKTTKLGRRRLIEDLNEQKMLEAELSDFDFA